MFELFQGLLQKVKKDLKFDISQLETEVANMNTTLAGNGLSASGNVLNVNVGSGLELNSNSLRVAASLAGSGLSGGGGSPLAVNTDNTTLEIVTDILKIKNPLINGVQTTTMTNVSFSFPATPPPAQTFTFPNKLIVGFSSTVTSTISQVGRPALYVTFNSILGSGSHPFTNWASPLTFNGGQPYGQIVFQPGGSGYGGTVTFTNNIVYYITLPTISY